MAYTRKITEQFRSGYYILDSAKNVVPVDMETWARWNDSRHREGRVGINKIGHRLISTLFIGYDHSDSDEPMVFETVVFPEENCQARYSTWAQAAKGHQIAVALAREFVGRN